MTDDPDILAWRDAINAIYSAAIEAGEWSPRLVAFLAEALADYKRYREPERLVAAPKRTQWVIVTRSTGTPPVRRFA